MKHSVRPKIHLMLPLLIALFSAPLMAADLQAPEPLDIETIEDFAVYKSAITDQLEHSDTYVEITPDNRSRALILMSEITAIIDRGGSIDELPPVPRVELFNRQEELNQILTNAANDSRVICRRERPTGSRLPINNCKTLAERRDAREGGKKYLRDILPGEERIKTR